MSSFDSAAIQADLFAGNLFAEDVQADKSSLRFSDDFWMYKFKIHPCCKSYPHKWSLCPWAHEGETGRRRCSKTHSYKPFICPYVRKTEGCPYGQNCIYAHNVFEQWLHPAKYKTKLCCYGAKCMRPLCFFAHTVDELRPEDKKALQSRPRASNSPVIKPASEEIPESDVKAICETASNVLESLLPKMSLQINSVPGLLPGNSLNSEVTKMLDKRPSSSSLSPTLSLSKSSDGLSYGTDSTLSIMSAHNGSVDRDLQNASVSSSSHKVPSYDRPIMSQRSMPALMNPSSMPANNSMDNLVALLMMLQQRQNAQAPQTGALPHNLPNSNPISMLPLGQPQNNYIHSAGQGVSFSPYGPMYMPSYQMAGSSPNHPLMLM